MNNATHTHRLLLALGSLMLLSACTGTATDTQYFADEDQVRDVDRIAAAQAAAGARTEATLRPMHFDGTRLNSLGRSQLHLMLMDRPANQPVVIYLDAPGDRASERRSAVAAYLQGAGVPSGSYDLKTGPNPEGLTPADGGLRRLDRTESVPGSGSSSGFKPTGTMTSSTPSGTR